MKNMFSGSFAGRTVLVTGHTGFKGAWLCCWLKLLGAKVIGYSLQPPTEPSLFEVTGLEKDICHIIGDVRDQSSLQKAFASTKPEIVFHLAAQPLVRLSYEEPVETFSTNVMGTINVLEAVKSCASVRAVVVITSDKCYENNEWPYAYRENDPMGGFDPYSASKGCTELVVASWRRSFFKDSKTANIASARAGNVIGGGDWALDRIVPDAVRSLSNRQAVPIRNPYAVRPWQHVLEPLSGYLWLAAKLLNDENEIFSDAWNFGPFSSGAVPVKELVEQIVNCWGSGEIEDLSSGQKNAVHEANFLRLDCSKASGLLDWRPVFDIEKTIEFTTSWYKQFYESKNFDAGSFTEEQIFSYARMAEKSGAVWACAESVSSGECHFTQSCALDDELVKCDSLIEKIVNSKEEDIWNEL